MLLVSELESSRWCEQRGLGSSGGLKSGKLAFRDGEQFRSRFAVQGSATDVVSLAYVMIMTGVPNDDEAAFTGGLVVLQDWDIWSETIERVGHLLLHRCRAIVSPTPSVLQSPGHILGATDFTEAQTLVTLPLLFQWEALYVPADGTFACLISHHGHFDILSRGRTTHQRILARFKAASIPLQDSTVT